MGCGCHQRNIDYASNNEFYKKAVKIAKVMAMDEGTWYIVIKRCNGKYDFMSVSAYVAVDGDKIVDNISPLPFYAAT
jgi:hypothetical protein